MLEVAAISVGLVILALMFLRKPKYRLPPGPPGLPILGNIHQIDAKCSHESITNWSYQYGDVFTFRQFTENVVVVNDYETIYETLVTKSQDFAGRPPAYRCQFVLNFHNDITFNDYTERLRYMKKVTMQAMRMYGDRLRTLEQLSLEAIGEMTDDLTRKAEADIPVDMHPTIHKCSAAIVSSVVWGHRLSDMEMNDVLNMNKVATEILAPTGPGAEMEWLPILRFLPTESSRKMYWLRDAYQKWFGKKNLESKNSCKNREPSCIVEAIFGQQERDRRRGEALTLTDEEISTITMDLMSAGTITTSASMYSLIAVLVNRPELQDLLTTEIHAVIGRRAPTLQDRKALPYVEATVLEVLRYATITPFAIPHAATTHATLHGFDIPKGTMVLLNLWKLHHNSQYWEDPWQFKPERFLAEDGTLLPSDNIKRKRLLPFGAGPRVCLGEVLARNRLFLIVTSLLQQFHFRPEREGILPVCDPRMYTTGLVVTPPTYRIRLISI